MNKPSSQPANPVSFDTLSDEIGVTTLEEIIEGLGLPKREAYEGDDLRDIRGVYTTMTTRNSTNVITALEAYLEALDTPKETASSRQKTEPQKAKKKKSGRITRNKKEVDTDLQQKFLKGKELEAQATVKAGLQDGSKLATAYRHGRQVGFLKQVLSDTITDATLVREQLGNITDAVLNDTTIDVDALLGDIEIPELGDINSVEQISDADGLGFTGILGGICQGYLPEETEEEEDAA